MVDPVGADDDKAQCIDQKLRCQRRQETRPKLAAGGSLRQLQFEHHDGNDDGDDTITESGDALDARTIAAVLDLHHFPPFANARGTRLALALLPLRPGVPIVAGARRSPAEWPAY